MVTKSPLQCPLQQSIGPKPFGIGSKTFVAIGSNLEVQNTTTEGIVRAGLHSLNDFNIRMVAQSYLYNSPAFPAGSGPDFVNAVVQLEFDGDSQSLLSRLHEIETNFGRERNARWGARTLDLDLLTHRNEILPGKDQFRAWVDLPLDQQKLQTPDHLILPHPRIQDRAFVLLPLADIAPDWVHPVFGTTTMQMLNALDKKDRAEIRRID